MNRQEKNIAAKITALQKKLYQQDKLVQDLLSQESEALSEKSLFHFYRTAWSVFEKGDFKANWHHHAMCEALEALYRQEIPNLILQVPPGCSKSSLASVAFPVWCWLQDASTRFISGCAEESLATRDPGRSRMIIESQWFQSLYGNKFSLLPDNNRKSYYENDKRGYRIAITPGGKKGIGQRFDILLIDDPHAPTEIYSKAAKAAVWRWWSELLSTRGSEVGRQCIIHQRLSLDDLIGRILKNSDLSRWEVISFQMEFDPTKTFIWTSTNRLPNRDPRKEKGELLWPDVQTPTRVANTKAGLSTPMAISAQLQQDPIADEGNVIKKENFRYYSYPNKSLFLQKLNAVYTSWDLTYGDDGTSHCVGQVWGILGSSRFLIDQVRGKWDFPEQVKQLRALHKKYPMARGHLIEKMANGDAMKKSLDPEIPGLIWVTASDVGGSSKSKDKSYRLSAALPQIDAGNIYIPNPDKLENNWVKIFLEECVAFPAGDSEDCVDTMTQFLNYVSSKHISNRVITYTDKELLAFIHTSQEKGLLPEYSNRPFIDNQSMFTNRSSHKSLRGIFQ
jgi:predicted phage terminase large subunit-like protein